MAPRSLLASLAAAALFLAACGGGGGSNSTPTPTPTSEAPTPAGPPLSDEEYLRVFCTGVTNYREALNTEPREGLVRVVEEYVASMRAVSPPADIAEFHAAFIRYLEDAVAEPTALITRQPPLPPDEARSRLADKARSIDECRYPTFLDGGSD
jgi:hypothetical protein